MVFTKVASISSLMCAAFERSFLLAVHMIGYSDAYLELLEYHPDVCACAVCLYLFL